jgi:hypothetical protein
VLKGDERSLSILRNFSILVDFVININGSRKFHVKSVELYQKTVGGERLLNLAPENFILRPETKRRASVEVFKGSCGWTVEDYFYRKDVREISGKAEGVSKSRIFRRWLFAEGRGGGIIR